MSKQWRIAHRCVSMISPVSSSPTLTTPQPQYLTFASCLNPVRLSIIAPVVSLKTWPATGPAARILSETWMKTYWMSFPTLNRKLTASNRVWPTPTAPFTPISFQMTPSTTSTASFKQSLLVLSSLARPVSPGLRTAPTQVGAACL